MAASSSAVPERMITRPLDGTVILPRQRFDVYIEMIAIIFGVFNIKKFTRRRGVTARAKALGTDSICQHFERRHVVGLIRAMLTRFTQVLRASDQRRTNCNDGIRVCLEIWVVCDGEVASEPFIPRKKHLGNNCCLFRTMKRYNKCRMILGYPSSITDSSTERIDSSFEPTIPMFRIALGSH